MSENQFDKLLDECRESAKVNESVIDDIVRRVKGFLDEKEENKISFETVARVVAEFDEEVMQEVEEALAKEGITITESKTKEDKTKDK